jgi:tetratricopeptide (TPR) repeat protein
LFPRTFLPTVAATLLALPSLAWADGEEPAAAGEPANAAAAENQQLAADLQLAAIEAMMAGDWPTAEQRARAALALDAGPRSAQARIIVARALEQRGAVREALDELEVLLAQDLLPQHRAKAEEIQQRLTARSPRGPQPPASTPPLSPAARRGIGIGALAGGAAPLVIGGMMVGWDIDFASRGIESGTWAAIGAPLLITGIAAEVIGVALVAAPPKRAASALTIVPIFALRPSGRSGTLYPTLHVGVSGQW